MARVAIIVPYRATPRQNREKELKQFISHMTEFMSGTQFKIFIVEQAQDGRKFNRGKLLNVGFKIASKENFDSFIFHDVDLLPHGEAIGKYYKKVPTRPIHIGRAWGRYNGNKYFGGIIAFNEADFRKIDGFPNSFWGWGGEDDELGRRVVAHGLQVELPPRKLTEAIQDLEELSLQEKLFLLKKNKEWKCNNKWEVRDSLQKFREKKKPPGWGLKGVTYKVEARETLNESTVKIGVCITKD